MLTMHKIYVPAGLHVDSQELIVEFVQAIAQKLREAEVKYDYENGWLTQDWENECRRHLHDHLEKGDPRDVAIYAAFMWKRGWSTTTWYSIETAPKGLPTENVGERGSSNRFRGRRKDGVEMTIRRLPSGHTFEFADDEETYYTAEWFTHWSPLSKTEDAALA